VWGTEIEPLLVADEEGKLEAKTIFDEMCRRQPGKFEGGQLRSLQRRVREWRAEQGPNKEVYFPQEHRAGQMGAIDFTHGSELKVTIAGAAFAHLFFQFVLAFSGWRFVQLAFGETFEALLSGLQSALFELGGVPLVVRLDNLSAATHELMMTGGRALTTRFTAVVEHYGFKASRIQPGEGHENGVVEKAHDLLKSAIDQALRLRCSRDFSTIEAYVAFVDRIVGEKFNAGRADKVAAERAVLRPLPATRMPEYTRVHAVLARALFHHGQSAQFHEGIEPGSRCRPALKDRGRWSRARVLALSGQKGMSSAGSRTESRTRAGGRASTACSSAS
jgi:hypothetical protein